MRAALGQAAVDTWESERTPVAPSLFQALGEAGAFAEDPFAAWVLMEEAGALAAAGLTLALAGHALTVLPLVRTHATAPFQDKWGQALTQGRAMGAMALAEPGAAGDPTQAATRAAAAKGQWRITGEKSPVVMGEGATVLVVHTRVDDQHALFALPLERERVGVHPLAHLRGMRCAGLARVTFSQVTADPDHLLGEPTGDLQQLAAAAPWRMVNAAALVTHGLTLLVQAGPARGALAQALEDHRREGEVLRVYWRQAVTDNWNEGGSPMLPLARARSWRFFDGAIALAGRAGSGPVLTRARVDRATALLRPPFEGCQGRGGLTP